MPAVEFDDGRRLAESGAPQPVFPGRRLGPAQILQWMYFEQYTHEPYIAVNRYLKHCAPPGDPRLAHLAPNAEKGPFALSVMEQYLAGHDWFAPTGYSIADMALYAYTHVADEGGFDLARYRRVRAWLDRVREQPGYVPMMEETNAEPVRRLGG